ncbi:MAG TPA: hypothetical protein VGV92_07635 [Gammaproteobacteria bacterium]|nr:hypothetical protein [Gammaproteobacteria bacterium]
MHESYSPFLPLSVLAAAPYKNEVGEEIYLQYVAACLLKGGVALPRAEFDLNYSLESIRTHTNDDQIRKTFHLEILMQYASIQQDRLSDYKNFFEDARVSDPNSSVHFSNLVMLLEHSIQSGRNSDHEVVRYLLEKLKQHNRFVDILDLAETSVVMIGNEKVDDFERALIKFLLLCHRLNLSDEYQVVIQNCIAHYKAPVDIKGEFDLFDLIFFLVSKSADLFSWIKWKKGYGLEFSRVLKKAEEKGILNAAQCAQFNALLPALDVSKTEVHNIRGCFTQPNLKEAEEFFDQLNFQNSDAGYEILDEQNKKTSVAFSDFTFDKLYFGPRLDRPMLPAKVFLGRSSSEINQFLAQGDQNAFFSFLTGQPYDAVELKHTLSKAAPGAGLPVIVGLMLGVPRTASDFAELKPPAVFPDMSRIPLALYVDFIHHNGAIPQAFYDFVELFDKANAHVKEQENAEEDAESGEEHLINYDAFMVKNIFKLTGLHELLGGDLLFKLMMSKMGASNLVLDRFLDGLGAVPERYASVIKTLAPMIKKNEYDIFGNIILLISQIEFFADELEQKGKKPAVVPWEELTRPPVNLSKIMEVLSDVLVTLYKDLLDVPKDVKLDLSKLLSSPQLIRRLITGRGHLESNDYRAVFDRLVIQDLTNNKVEDELMQRLAAHNQAIEDELNSKGINAKLALHYPKQVAFSFDRNPGATDMTQLCNALWASLLELEKNI